MFQLSSTLEPTMTRALHHVTSPRPELFAAPPMTSGVEAHEILSPVFFQEDSAELDPAYDALLDDFAAVLAWFDGQVGVEVRGHADDRGGDAQDLSARRARAVVFALEARGVRPGLLRPRALAGRRPASGGYAPLERAVNRRVELHLLAPSQPARMAA